MWLKLANRQVCFLFVFTGLMCLVMTQQVDSRIHIRCLDITIAGGIYIFLTHFALTARRHSFVCNCSKYGRSQSQCYMKNLFKLFTKVSLTKKYSFEDDSPVTDGDATELKALSHSIEKRLVERDLVSLDAALNSRGGVVTGCVLYPSHDHREERAPIETPPQIVFFRVFRHPKVRNSSELKRLPCCSHPCEDSRKVCINPYHYSAIVVINRDPVTNEDMCTNYSSNDKPADRSSSGFISNLTESTCPTDRSRPRSLRPHGSLTQDLMRERKRMDSWCSIAYWEQSKRVGPFYEGIADVINVFETLPVPDGFCLATLDRISQASEKTKQILTCIGYGLQLSRELDGIWLYNRSEHALFANGSTLNHRTRRNNFPVFKIPPGFSLKVYDFFSTSAMSPSGPETVRISFVKGWGRDYKRPYVTCCPCWIEVHFCIAASER